MTNTLEHSTATIHKRPTTEGGRLEFQEVQARKLWRDAGTLAQTRLSDADRLMGAQPDPVERARRARAIQLDVLQRGYDVRGDTKRPVTAMDHMAFAIVGMPSAAATSRELDRRGRSRGGTTDRQLAGQMIRYSHDVKAAAEAVPRSALRTFTPRLISMAREVFPAGQIFDERTYAARMNGISGEFAVEQALQGSLPEGWEVVGSSTLGDLDGDDIWLTSGDGRVLGIDVKAGKAFDEELAELWKHDRISRDEYSAAEADRYLYLPTDRAREGIVRCMVDADAEILGGRLNHGFEYADPDTAAQFFVEMLEDTEVTTASRRALQKIGNRVINS